MVLGARRARMRRGKDVTRDDTEIGLAVHRALAGKVGQNRYEMWFGRGVRMEPCGKMLHIAAADPFRLEYIRRVLHADLLEAARSVMGDDVQLELVVDASLAASEATPAAPDVIQPTLQFARPADAEQPPAKH